MYTYFKFLHLTIAVCQPITSFMAPQPTPTWTGAKIYKLSQIQHALALLSKGFRKLPESSRTKVPNIVKSHQKFKKHKEHEDDDSESVEASDYCRKLRLPGSSNNKVAKGLAKFVRQQLGLEMIEVSK